MRAPAILVEVVLETSSGDVEFSSVIRLDSNSSSTSRKGRYLLLDKCPEAGFAVLDLIPFAAACCDPLIFNLFVESLNWSPTATSPWSERRFVVREERPC